MDASGGTAPAPDRSLRQRLLLHAGVKSRRSEGRRVAHHLYGTIIVLAVLVTADQKGTQPLYTAIVLALTVAVLLGMEAYADVVSREVELRRPLTRAERVGVVRELLGVMAGAEAPLVFLLVAAVGLLSVETAFALAEATTLASLFFYGYQGRSLAGRSRRESLLAGAVVAGIGLVLALGKGYIHI